MLAAEVCGIQQQSATLNQSETQAKLRFDPIARTSFNAPPQQMTFIAALERSCCFFRMLLWKHKDEYFSLDYPVLDGNVKVT
jgi:hypothetical protein